MTKAADNSDQVIAYARCFLGVPYIWGGNSPVPGTGFDCSGFICWVLRSFGFIGKEDLTAQMLFDHFSLRNGPYGPTVVTFDKYFFKKGDLLFFGKTTAQITHVGLAVDPARMIEAGGGDKRCDHVGMSARFGACVRERMIIDRSDFVATISLEYPDFYKYVPDKQVSRQTSDH